MVWEKYYIDNIKIHWSDYEGTYLNWQQHIKTSILKSCWTCLENKSKHIHCDVIWMKQELNGWSDSLCNAITPIYKTDTTKYYGRKLQTLTHKTSVIVGFSSLWKRIINSIYNRFQRKVERISKRRQENTREKQNLSD